MNLTILPKATEITTSCFDWCKEQNFIHQQNLEAGELSFIIIALVALVIHNVIYSYYDFFISIGIDEEILERTYDATSLLVFVMLILFVIYMRWFR